MRDAGALPHGAVASVSVEALTDGGTGFTGETVRVRLTYEGADSAPATVVAKFPTADRQNRGMLEQFDAYAREIRFYQRYAHRMPCPTPTYLGADYDHDGVKQTGPRMARLIDALPDRIQLAITKDVTKFMRATNRRYVLLIEDLGSGTTVHDMTRPPDDEQVGAALETLATVHAAFWNDPGLEGDDVFRPIVTNTPGLYQTVGRKRCVALAEERWGEWLTDHHVALIMDALDRLADDVVTVNRKLTLIHGDTRADNILYRHDGVVVLLDWALAAHAHPGYDVGYLMSSCLGPDRIDAADALVSRYEAALESASVEAGVGGRASVDADELRAVIGATYRTLAVQQLMSIPVLHGSYGDQSIADLWMPRILAGLAHEW